MLPIVRGEYREAWALTEPGAGSDLAGARRDGRPRRRRLGAERREVVRHERGRRRASTSSLAVHEGEQTLFLVEPGTPGMEIARTPRFLHDPYLDHHPEIVLHATAACRRRTACPRAATRARRSGSSSSASSSPRAAAAPRCASLDETTAWAQEREAFGVADRRVPGRLVPARRLAHRAARRAAAHLPRGARVRRARRPQGRAREGLDGEALRVGDGRPGRRPRRADLRRPRLHADDTAAARFYRELRVDRIWEGTSEIQRLIIARGLVKRGAAPYLGWE